MLSLKDMLYDLLFKKLDAGFISRKLILVLIGLLFSAFLVFWIFFNYAVKPKAQQAPNKFMLIDTSPLFQNKYLAPNDPSLPDLWWWAAQDVPSGDAYLQQGEYTLSARVKTDRVVNTPQGKFGIDVMLILEYVGQSQPNTGGQQTQGVFQTNSSQVFENVSQNAAPQNVMVQQIEFSETTADFIVKSKTFSFDGRMKGGIFIRARDGSGGVVDYVSLKDSSGTEVLINNDFRNVAVGDVDRFFAQGWGAGTPIQTDADITPYPWGYYFAFLSEISEGSLDMKSGLLINSVRTKNLSRVWTRYEKLFQANGDLYLQVKGFAPVLDGRGAAVWVACAGVRDRDISNTPVCSGYQASTDTNIGKCFFKDPATGESCYVDENQPFERVVSFNKESTLITEYVEKVSFPGIPENGGPFWVRISANDGSEVFVDSLNIYPYTDGTQTDAGAQDAIVSENFDPKVGGGFMKIKKLLPVGWSFGEQYFSARGFSPLDFVFMIEQKDLLIDTPATTPTPTDEPAATTIPQPSPTLTPTPDIGQGGQDSVRIDLKLRFQGIRSKPRSGVEQMKVLVSLRRFGESEFIHKTADVLVNDSGIWEGSVEFFPEDGYSPGEYVVYIKGPKHIQKAVCDLKAEERFPGAYKCREGGFLEIRDSQISLDLSEITLLVGDLPEQDGVVNAYDIGLVRNLLGRKDEESLRKADVNLDGIVNIADFVLLQAALSVRYDEGEFINLDIDG